MELIKNTQAALATANIRLLKVVSNATAVMEALPAEDRGKDVQDLDFRHDVLPTQRSLGVYWNLAEDTFTFQISLPEKPFTRRGVLSTVNSVYDPLGFAIPVVLKGKLLLQRLVAMGNKRSSNPLGWDDPLPDDLKQQWRCWKESLVDLGQVVIPRCYKPKDLRHSVRNEIHAFSDASQEAIGAAVYLRQLDERHEVNVSFLYGQSRVASTKPTSIPRLELCGAVLSTQAVKKVFKELDFEIDEVTFYTDSKVVLGYIRNEIRRFYVYVANRVQMIRNGSSPEQWHYVDTGANPADLATREVTAKNLPGSQWLNGPDFLKEKQITSSPRCEDSSIDENDPKVRRQVNVFTNEVEVAKRLGAARIFRFSTWSSLRRGIANLIVKAKEFKTKRDSKQPVECRIKVNNTTSRQNKQQKIVCLPRLPSVKELNQASIVAIKAVQEETFPDELRALKDATSDHSDVSQRVKQPKEKLKSSSLYRLDPFIDKDGVMRVGGRLRHSNFILEEKHPMLLPKEHHLSILLVKHYHEKVHHQGRQITHGAFRQAGYWVIRGHGTVSKVLRSCVFCRRLRGRALNQFMADLPADRTDTSPPFTNVGFDVFGPWSIRTRKLRGGAANSKRWGLVLTCLSSRAIHIEVLESMDASAFICALRRFFAMRGPASLLRCDRGTNFIGAKSEPDDALAELDQQMVEKFVAEQGCEWSFNPPHASHFGGV